MKKFLILLFLSPLSSLGDPFYSDDNTKQAVKSEQIFEKTLLRESSCQPKDKSNQIMLDIEFDKLTLIGLIRLSNHYKALFIDSDNKIYDFSENQYLLFSQIQIKNIDLKEVSYIDWGKSENCHTPIIKTIKL